jgi:hypothetical protein
VASTDEDGCSRTSTLLDTPSGDGLLAYTLIVDEKD